MSERNEFPCETSTDFVAVRRYAVEWLKTHYPALTVKAGLCESIGGRLYTRTVLTTHPHAAAVLQQEAGEPHPNCPKAFVCAGRCSGDRCADAMAPATPQVSPPQARVPLTDVQIEAGRRDTFSTENPFCPCDSKTMRKAVRWAERAHLIGLETKE